VTTGKLVRELLDRIERVVYGANRGITDYDVIVWTSAVQYADGTLDDGSDSEQPSVHVDIAAANGMSSSQARELAVLLV
jgi:hypothetical protein